MARYCEPLIASGWNSAGAEFAFSDAAQLVDDAAEGNFDRDSIRTQKFTELVKERSASRTARACSHHTGGSCMPTG
jgi:hypothetical protein